MLGYPAYAAPDSVGVYAPLPQAHQSWFDPWLPERRRRTPTD